MREPIRDKERLEHIVEAIDNIFSFAKGKTVEDLNNEKILFYAVVKNIEIIGEAAFRLTKEFRQQHSETPWSSIVVMRHVLYMTIIKSKAKRFIRSLMKICNLFETKIVLYISETDWETWEKQEIAPTESAVHKNMVQSARRMLSKGYGAKEISEITGLSLEEISML